MGGHNKVSAPQALDSNAMSASATSWQSQQKPKTQRRPESLRVISIGCSAVQSTTHTESLCIGRIRRAGTAVQATEGNSSSDVECKVPRSIHLHVVAQTVAAWKQSSNSLCLRSARHACDNRIGKLAWLRGPCKVTSFAGCCPILALYSNAQTTQCLGSFRFLLQTSTTKSPQIPC